MIASAAACLDDLHKAPIYGEVYRESRAAAEQHIKNLHDIATAMAGDQVDEVYAPDDSNPLTLIQAAGLSVASAETDPECAPS
jgi:hypothetical protein